MISDEILLKYNGRKKDIKKGTMLFSEGGHALFFFQVARGEVKMYNFNDDGKEFIQGIFTDNDSFGEPPLLNNKPYLTNAIATTDSEVWTLTKEDFIKMLRNDSDAAVLVCKRLSDRLYYKSLMAMEISSEDAEHRLLRFFDYLKSDVAKVGQDNTYLIDLTRQELADLTGLRVETVIRSVKSLEKKKAIKIIGRKIFR
ncbi:MAG TPA: Crp/Fnr family transcriptional regulator [Flavobacterium sp.]